MYRTKEQLDMETAHAKEYPIVAIAEQFGYDLTKRGRYYTNNKGLVIYSDTNSFFDFYENKGGSTIDFVMREHAVGVGEAVRYINELSGKTIDYAPSVPERHITRRTGKEFILPERNDNHHRAFAYLTKARGIAPGLVSKLMHEKKIYESKDNHNVIFVAFDENNEPKHGFVRGSLSGVRYRGDVDGSDKSYGFVIDGAQDDDRLVVFEAPIDLLSYITMFPADASHKIALGMLSDEPIWRFLETHESISRISLVLDNDLKGQQASERFRVLLEANGYDVVCDRVTEMMQMENVKDVNELLVLKQPLCKRQVR